DCRPKQFEGFLTGFLVEDAAPFGPPGLAALTDGLLLVSDDDTSWPSQPRADRRRLSSLHSRHMTTPAYLGEFEHLLLLAVLRLGSEAYGLDIARELDARAGRSVSRGALYTSLDRLEDNGLPRWKPSPGS